LEIDAISRLVTGLRVSDVAKSSHGALEIHFADGRCLVVRRDGDGVAATLRAHKPRAGRPGEGEPSARQREYLHFIVRYLSRFGISPSEADIQQHFLVSAPSVNQMMKTLERRGFITRSRDWYGQAMPRSIRVLVDLD